MRTPPDVVQYRAKKQKRGHPPLVGTLRDTWDEAFLDLPTLSFDAAIRSRHKPLLRDFMFEQLNGIRKREQSYGTWKRDEIIWRTRVYTSELGAMPIDEIEDTDCQAFIDAQVRLAPERDARGRIQLYEELRDEKQRGLRLPDLDRPIGWRENGKRRLICGGLPNYIPTEIPLDPGGAKRVGACLSVYFEIARSRRLKLIRVNPMADVDYPKERKGPKQRKSLTPQKAANLPAKLIQFLTALDSQGARFEAMVLTARDTGLRSGEICGLEREKVLRSDSGPYLLVDSGIVRVEGGVGDSSTKTSIVREVPISEETYERIMALPVRSRYAFTTASGKPVRPDNFGATFRKFRKAAGLPTLKLQNLRNTYISLLLRAGVDIKTVQTLVGHTTPKMIMQVYGETFDESMREAPEKLRKLLESALNA